MAFCGNCGTKADSNKFCTKCGSQIVMETKNKNKSSNFGQLLDMIEKNDALLAISGLVNIESGEISVRAPRKIISGEFAHPLTDCSECDGQKTQGLLYFVNCESCLRSHENYFWIKSGNGDGVYTVLEIWQVQGEDEDLLVIGMMAILVPTAEFTQPIVDEAIKNNIQIVDSEYLRTFNSLEAFAITSMNVAGGEIYITDSSTGFDSGNSSYNRFIFEETSFDFYAFAEISPTSQNASFQKERAAVMKIMTEEFGASSQPSEISVIPRVIVGLNQDWIQSTGFEAGLTRPDDEEIFWDWFNGHQDNHLELQTGTAAWFNSKIANLKYGDEHQELELSYLLLGATHGDQDCLKALKSPGFASALDDSEKVADLLVMQDQLLIANEIRESDDVKGWLKKLDLIELTEEEWFEQFKPIPNHLDDYASFENDDEKGTMFETYGEELEFIRAQNPNAIWTYANGDNGGTYILNGYSEINRIGYFITAIPFDDFKDYQIEIWEGDEE